MRRWSVHDDGRFLQYVPCLLVHHTFQVVGLPLFLFLHGEGPLPARVGGPVSPSASPALTARGPTVHRE